MFSQYFVIVLRYVDRMTNKDTTPKRGRPVKSTLAKEQIEQLEIDWHAVRLTRHSLELQLRALSLTLAGPTGDAGRTEISRVLGISSNMAGRFIADARDEEKQVRVRIGLGGAE